MADNQQPIVVKRVKKVAGGHHGGAWKIAYADFVTAMMAFFLLMWLLGSTTKGDLKGIADYFQTPLKLSLQGGDGSGTATSLIPGGGADLTKSVGEAARAAPQDKRSTAPTITPVSTASEVMQGEVRKGLPVSGEQEAVDRKRLQELKARVEAMVEASPSIRNFKNQLLLDLTSEGLRIQIVDEQNRPMFDVASSEMRPYARLIVRALGEMLNQVENKVSISGHTDAALYSGGVKAFSNWELSANRANASRRELVAGGFDERKIMRVVGLASTIPFDRNDPYSAVNRRISLVVLNKRTEEAVLRDGTDVDMVVGKGLQLQHSSAAQ